MSEKLENIAEKKEKKVEGFENTMLMSMTVCWSTEIGCLCLPIPKITPTQHNKKNVFPNMMIVQLFLRSDDCFSQSALFIGDISQGAQCEL